MTDAETRAELNRLLAADESDLTVDDLLRLPAGAVSLLRLLAESQQALREIREVADKREPDSGEEGKVLDEIINLTIKEE